MTTTTPKKRIIRVQVLTHYLVPVSATTLPEAIKEVLETPDPRHWMLVTDPGPTLINHDRWTFCGSAQTGEMVGRDECHH